MSNRYFTLSNEEDKDYTLPYIIDLALCDDVAATIRQDGGECPDGVHAASFTHDREHDPDVTGVIYLPHNAGIRTIIHEAVHAIIGACHRDGMTVPSRSSADEDEELFVETIALLSEHIIDTINPEVTTCQ